MERKCENPLRVLKDRFDVCFEKYKTETLKMGIDKVFDFASEIIAAREVHIEMCFWLEMSMSNKIWPNSWHKEPISEKDAAFLLSLEDPLAELADKWWYYTLGNKVDFQEFFRTLNKNSR